jgi:L-Ala-D/L-Glu epimerase
MAISVDIFVEQFLIAGAFVISRGAKTRAEVVRVLIRDGDIKGQGECVPYARYGETVVSVVTQINVMKPMIINGLSLEELQFFMPKGAARNAIDCALWDFKAKKLQKPVFEFLNMPKIEPVTTAFTLSMGTPEAMALVAHHERSRPILKIKVGGDGDIERLRFIRNAAPKAKIIVDANEGWNELNIVENLNLCALLGIVMVEQPLPQGKDGLLAEIEHPILIFADESVHDAKDLAQLKGRYDGVNIKLDKTGGLTQGLIMCKEAKINNLEIMVGCMVGSSLSMAPAWLLAQYADFVDLDGPLLLQKDRENGLFYDGSVIHPPKPDLWG